MEDWEEFFRRRKEPLTKDQQKIRGWIVDEVGKVLKGVRRAKTLPDLEIAIEDLIVLSDGYKSLYSEAHGECVPVRVNLEQAFIPLFTKAVGKPYPKSPLIKEIAKKMKEVRFKVVDLKLPKTKSYPIPDSWGLRRARK